MSMAYLWLGFTGFVLLCVGQSRLEHNDNDYLGMVFAWMGVLISATNIVLVALALGGVEALR